MVHEEKQDEERRIREEEEEEEGGSTFPVRKDGWKRKEQSSITVDNLMYFQIGWYCMH